MKYVLVDSATQAWIGAPVATKPTPAAGQFVVLVPDFWPDQIYWRIQPGPAGTPIGGFVDYLSEARCLDMIDGQAATLRAAVQTTSPGMADMYRRKMAEVAVLNTLGGTTAQILAAVRLMTAAQQQASYPFLYAEMQAAGLADLAAARDRVVAAANVSAAPLAAIERYRRAAKIAVRAATTLAAKNTAAVNAAWPT